MAYENADSGYDPHADSGSYDYLGDLSSKDNLGQLKRKYEDRNDNGDSKRRRNGNETSQSDSVNDSGESLRRRGRGEDIKKPAWMTKQESHSSLSEDVKSIGRGRGI